MSWDHVLWLSSWFLLYLFNITNVWFMKFLNILYNGLCKIVFFYKIRLISWFNVFELTSKLRCMCGLPSWHSCNGKRLDTFPITLNAIHVGYNAQVDWWLRTSWELGTLEVLVWDTQLFFLFAPLSPLDWPLEFVVISDHQTKYHFLLEFKSTVLIKSNEKEISRKLFHTFCEISARFRMIETMFRFPEISKRRDFEPTKGRQSEISTDRAEARREISCQECASASASGFEQTQGDRIR